MAEADTGPKVFKYHQLTCSERFLYDDLHAFFAGRTLIEDVFLPMLSKRGSTKTGTAFLSGRLIQWFVTEYIHSRAIRYWVRTHSGRRVLFDLCASYTRSSKHWDAMKQMFDPFRRKSRILWPIYGGTKCFVTTLCHLNFFRWLVENDILSYIGNHYARILQHKTTMHQYKQLLKQKSGAACKSKKSSRSRIVNTDSPAPGSAQAVLRYCKRPLESPNKLFIVNKCRGK